MTRPTQATIQNGEQAWDADVNDNFTVVLSQPFPIYLDAALTESNLAATWAASSYSQCLVWVNHSVRGYTLYQSNGTVWKICRGVTPNHVRSISAVTSLGIYDDTVICGGTTYTVTLPPPATYTGVLTIKRNSSGDITVARNASETIDGVGASFVIDTALQSITLITDGTNWFII